MIAVSRPRADCVLTSNSRSRSPALDLLDGAAGLNPIVETAKIAHVLVAKAEDLHPANDPVNW